MKQIGQKFALLTVQALHERRVKPTGTVLIWRCLCECGGTAYVRFSQLKNGMSKSCGCLKRKAGDRTRTHGKSKTKVYQLWSAMIQRGRGHRAASYAARGIVVCERWRVFEEFFADMGEPPGPNYSVERVDNLKGYSPDNCIWLPMREQWRNRTNTSLLEFEGEPLSLREIAQRCGIKASTLRHRIKSQGMTLQQAISK